MTDADIPTARAWLQREIRDAKAAAGGHWEPDWQPGGLDCLPDLATPRFLELADGSPQKYAAVCGAALAWLGSIDPEGIAAEIRIEMAGRHFVADEEANRQHKIRAKRALYVIDYRSRLHAYTSRQHKSRDNDYPGRPEGPEPAA